MADEDAKPRNPDVYARRAARAIRRYVAEMEKAKANLDKAIENAKKIADIIEAELR